MDEPALSPPSTTDPYEGVRRLYERVKAVAPAIPVMMVHAPIPAYVEEAGTVRPITQAEVDAELEEIEAFSQYADTIGFDIYPVASEPVLLTTPYQGGAVAEYRTLLPDYLRWLRSISEDRPYFLVLQGFSYHRQWAPGQSPVETRFPTVDELQTMACQTLEGGASSLGWWGPSFLLVEDALFWDDLLETSSRAARTPVQTCGANLYLPLLSK